MNQEQHLQMLNHHKLQEILQHVKDATRAGKLTWRPINRGDFTTSLSAGSIFVSAIYTDQRDGDYCNIRVSDKKGKLLVEATTSAELYRLIANNPVANTLQSILDELKAL